MITSISRVTLPRCPFPTAAALNPVALTPIACRCVKPFCQCRLTTSLPTAKAWSHQVRYVCPLFHPQPTCLVDSPGARLRHQLDRQSETYKLIDNQRSATERINALALELGIERPKFRNGHSITNTNISC